MGAISIACRFFFRNGFCANSSVGGERCVGATCAEYRDETGRTSSVSVTVGSEPAGDSTCEHDLGSVGLYCRKYGVFFCAGKDNCGSEAEFMRHFDSHNRKRKTSGGSISGRTANRSGDGKNDRKRV